MATYNTREPVVHERTIGHGTEEIKRRPNWLWPLLALAALTVLGLIFSRGMDRRNEAPVIPQDTERVPDMPMR